MIDYKTAAPDRYRLLKDLAKQNRLNPTLAEQFLWEHIRAGQIKHKVLRQYVVGDYIADFLLPDIKLIIEVDGAYHDERVQSEDDDIRERSLFDIGYNIIRFTNEEVLYDIDNTMEKIFIELDRYE